MHRQPVLHARWLPPAGLFRHRVQHREMLRRLLQQGLAHRQRIAPGRCRNLIDKAFKVEAVLIDVHTAPEPRRHMRIAHGVVDQQVGYIIPDRGLIAAHRHHALEDARVHAVLQGLRRHTGNDRLAADPHMQRREVALVVQPGRQLALRHRVVAPMQHVLFARPHQLDGRARHGLGDRHRLVDPVMHRAAPAKAAAKGHLVNFALLRPQAGSGSRCRQGGLAILRWRPEFAAFRRPDRHGIHRLHGRMVLMRIAVNRFDLACGAGERGRGIANTITNEGLRRMEPGLHHLGERGAALLRMGPVIVGDGDLVERRLGLPPGLGDDRDGGLTDRHHLLHAGHLLRRAGVEAGDLAAEDRAILDRRVQHAGQLQVDAIDQLTVGLLNRIQARERLAGDGPAFGILERDVVGRRQLGRLGGEAAIAGAPARPGMGHDAIGRGAFPGRHAPLIGRRLHQHHARRSATLADVFVALPDAARAAGREIAPDPVAGQILPRRRVFRGHLRPIGVQLLGHQLRKAGQRALTHFRTGDADDDGIIRLDHNPGIDLRHRGRAGLGGGTRHPDPKGEGPGGGRDGEEPTTGKLADSVHWNALPLQPRGPLPAACWMPASTRL